MKWICCMYLSLHAPVLLLPQKDSIELKLEDRGQENNRKELLFLSQSRSTCTCRSTFFSSSLSCACAKLQCAVQLSIRSIWHADAYYCVLGSLVFCFHGVLVVHVGIISCDGVMDDQCRSLSLLPALCMHTPSRMTQVELPIQPAGNLRGFSRSAK